MALILASASPQRRKLLRRLRRPFKIIPSRVCEDSREKNARKLVVLLARKKALEIARRRPGDVVIGADTTVLCAGRILNKPADRKDALRILKLLNGRWQRVYTGVAVAWDGGRRVKTAVAVSRVLCRTLSDERLASIAGRHMDKAGAYAVQDRADPFVARVVGPLDNVIGLPVRTVRSLLAKVTAARRSPKRG